MNIVKLRLRVLAGLLIAAFALALAFMTFVFSARPAGAGETDIYLYNPYRQVDFDTAGQYKGVLHTHTSQASGGSDGSDTPEQLVDRYADLGYTFIAITDHNYVRSAASTYENRSVTNSRGTINIAGSEWNNSGHHIGSLFHTNPVRGSEPGVQIANGIADSNGQGRFIMHHPGRYVTNDDSEGVPALQKTMDSLNRASGNYSAAWYKDIFVANKEVLGMEVYNQHNRYKNDRITYDRVLLETLSAPEHRPFWAIAGDDNHGGSYGNNAVIALLEDGDKDLDGFKHAMDTGAFFSTSFTNPAFGNGTGTNLTNALNRWNTLAPEVNDIIVDTETGTITIEAGKYSSIQWITGDMVNGTKILRTDSFTAKPGVGGVGVSVFNYKTNIGQINQYVRPLLLNSGGGGANVETFVQPFGVGPYNEKSGYFNYRGAVDAVIHLISKLPDAYSHAYCNEIIAAYDAYVALSEENKAKISEGQSAKLMTLYAFIDMDAYEAARPVSEGIAAINLVFGAALKTQLDALTAQYAALPDNVKGFVFNHGDLTAAIAWYADNVAAQAVDALILAISGANAASRPAAVKAARDAYNALTEAEKGFVLKLSILQVFESALPPDEGGNENPEGGDENGGCKKTTEAASVLGALSLLGAALFARKRK